MTERDPLGDADIEHVDHIESLLNEMTPADADLVDLPADLWGRIEGGARQRHRTNRGGGRRPGL